MIYIPERCRDFLFKSINSHPTTCSCIVSFSSRAKLQAALIFIQTDILRAGWGELCWDEVGDRKLHSLSDLIIQSVASVTVVCGPKKAIRCNRILRAGLPKTAISQCCCTTKCVYQMPITISRDITHQGLDVPNEQGMEMITGPHKGLFH